MKRLITALLAGLMAACMLLTACGGSADPTQGAAETTKAAAETTAAAAETTAAAEETTAAGGEVVEARLVKAAYTGIPDVLCPIKSMNSIASNAVHASVYEGLLHRDDDYKLEGSIADSWEISEDALTYTFHINPNATFSNGEKITAEDCAYSYTLLAASPERSFQYTCVDKFEAVDESTMVCTLKETNPLIISRFANPAVVSKKAYEAAGADKYGTDLANCVFSGAYVITEWENNVSVTLKARDDFWLGVPEIKDAMVYTITDTNGAMVAMQTGDLDIYWNPVSGSAYDTLSQCDLVHFSEYKSAKYENIHMYYKSGLYQDVRMRQAVAYGCVPDEALAVGVDGMGYTTRYPGDSEAINCNPDYDSPNMITFDLDKAKALVEECGKTGAATVIKSYQPDPYPALSTWLQGLLANIGLDATVEVMERASWLTACNAEEIEILILSWNGSAYDMDESFVDLVNSNNVGTSGNYGWYSSEEMDALIKKERSLATDAERTEVFKEMIDLMWKDVPFVPLYGVNSAIPTSNDLVVNNPRSYNFRDYHWAAK